MCSQQAGKQAVLGSASIPVGDGLERTLQNNLQSNAIYGVTMNEFELWFANLAGGNRPHPWQRALGEDAELRDRLIRIPTGFGSFGINLVITIRQDA